MDIKTLKPLRGWREFAGEVGVVVLGVLLALGAQQLAQIIQDRSDERAFQETINHEIGLNLFMYKVRARQFGCDSNRIGELKSWLARARNGEAVPAILASSPNVITPYRSAWDTRDAEVFNHLDARTRQKYAEFYDELDNNWTYMKNEDGDWGSLFRYAEPGPVSLEDRRTIRSVAAKIRTANELLEANIPISRKIAQVLGVAAIQPDNIPISWLRGLTDCRSVIAPAAG
jgi:hypothetical protein